MKCSECKQEIQCDLCGKTIFCKNKIIMKNEMTKAEISICQECNDECFTEK
ncbi:hypothetical protein [Clostridium saccharoperbutylacetonicum]|uniref:hypothetical protein n=1 Tax=Clostridium saccharoperbutylacetonicum TaxID=36745 RepID=UPI000347C890|nr:hypothetical protein [Clostridium saccharoperbutylacetonicum]NRT62816.1 ribosome-binding protein aMBF1 (putative translation factor) [Clostridium saccharoperbutylacetonicum]NSB26170.1 ribosome-binding protein aMBF1 (putative translation factor) [Clostridium saccharoperbutylacetonicum]